MVSVYIDLAIGLVLAFLLLSLLVSGINEGIVRLLAIRSKFLWAYLRDTFDGPDPTGRSALPSGAGDVFAALPFSRDPRPEHSPRPAPSTVEPMPDPVPDPVAEPTREPIPGAESTGTGVAADGATVADGAPPAEVMPPVDMTERLYERLREIDHPKRRRTSIAEIPPARLAGVVLEMVSAERGGVEGFLDKLKAMGSPLHGHLKGVWDGAQRDMDRFRRGVEDWFDTEMSRLTLLYRRYVRWVVAVLGLVVTLLFSMDGLEYGKTLLRDNGFRAGVAAIAGGGDGLSALRDRCSTVGEHSEPYACVTETLSAPALVQVFDHALVSVAIPDEGAPRLSWNFATWWDRVSSPGHWPGFLLTFVALLFGAPFWWDVLRRVTGIRSRLGGR